MNERTSARFSAQEKTILGLAIGATLLVWAVLTASLAIAQEGSYTARGAASLPAPSTPTALPTSTPTPTSTSTATTTPTPLPPTETATIVPSPTVTGTPSAVIGPDTIVVALLGIDEPRKAKIWRTDAIVLVLINEPRQRIGILSIPRDLWVFIPGHGHGRINTVDALGERTKYPGGGPGLLDQTLRYNLDIPIHYYARIDFRAFADLIDELGGVTVDVQAPIRDRVSDPLHPSGKRYLVLAKGRQTLDGATALAYCRSRMTTSDFDRSRRQQQVIVALATRLLTLDTLVRAPKLWEEYHDTVETDLTMPKAVRLAYIVQGIGIENTRTKGIGTGTTRSWRTPGGAQVLLPNTVAIQDTVRKLLSESE